MITVLLLGYYKVSFDEITAQWTAYGIYAVGVSAAIYLNRAGSEKFGDYFSQGFKSFIVITLLLVIFTGIFNYLHPEIAAANADAYRVSLQNAQNRTPDEIEQDVKLYREGFGTAIISRSIFGYLVFGAMASSISSFLMTFQKR